MRFFYLRDRNNHPIGCLATELHKANGNVKTDMVQYALSICNPQDQFKREQARALAAGRLATQLPKTYITIAPTDPPGQIKARILYNISRNPRFPQRARDAATRWILTNQGVKGLDSLAAQTPVQTGDPKQTESPIAGYATHMKNINSRPCPVCGLRGGMHTPMCTVPASIAAAKKVNSDAHLGAVETPQGVKYGS